MFIEHKLVHQNDIWRIMWYWKLENYFYCIF